MEGQAMLRVDNVKDEAALEAVRDALDRLGVDYRFARAEPDEDRFPQTAYFSTSPTPPRTRWRTRCVSSPGSTASTPRPFDGR